MPGSGFMGWVKGAVSTGGILHRVAEKAKNSVDTMITTLDPQMREFICNYRNMLLIAFVIILYLTFVYRFWW